MEDLVLHSSHLYHVWTGPNFVRPVLIAELLYYVELPRFHPDAFDGLIAFL